MRRERVSIAARNEHRREVGSIAASEASEERTDRCAQRTSRSNGAERVVRAAHEAGWHA